MASRERRVHDLSLDVVVDYRRRFHLYHSILNKHSPATMLEGHALEITLTAANSAAQAWYGYDQVCAVPSLRSLYIWLTLHRVLLAACL